MNKKNNKNLFQQYTNPLIMFFRSFLDRAKLFFSDHLQTLMKVVIPVLIVCCGYFACSNSQKSVTENVRKIFSLSDDIRAFYINKHDYWGLNTSVVIDNNIISSKYVRNKKIIFNGGIEILIGKGRSGEAVMPLTQEFDVVMNHLNKAQCMTYAETSLLPEELLKLNSIHILNSSGDYIFEWNGVRKLPIQKYETKNLCQNENNSVIWTIK